MRVVKSLIVFQVNILQALHETYGIVLNQLTPEDLYTELDGHGIRINGKCIFGKFRENLETFRKTKNTSRSIKKYFRILNFERISTKPFFRLSFKFQIIFKSFYQVSAMPAK